MLTTYKTNFSYSEIPQNYKIFLDSIDDEVVKKIYSQFSFQFFDFRNISNAERNSNKETIKSSLFFFLKENKFATYQISKVQKNSFIFCVENNCYIIESIDENEISQFISDIKSDIVEVKEEIEDKVKKIIRNSIFKKQIQNNYFVRYTIPTIIAFLIQRYTYPSSYFKDPSFFYFENKNTSKKSKFKENIQKLFLSKDLKKMNYEVINIKDNISQEINEINHFCQRKIHRFSKGDLIEFDTIYSKAEFNIYLAFHIPTFYIFVVKEMLGKNKAPKREISFCNNYSHRCFTPFYGFIYKGEEINGLVYEYMSNGSLKEFIKKDINPIFQFTTLIRILQGIHYLQSHCLIHRDLKPSNILIDHDNNAYLSDFEYIRPVNEKKVNDNGDNPNNENDNSEFTNDFGSCIYASPEQDEGTGISYQTDIYSFGALVYFILEKKNMFSEISNFDEIVILKLSQKFPDIINCTENIQKLYKKCMNIIPLNRPNLDEIKNVILEETRPIQFLENYWLKQPIDHIEYSQMIQFILENITLRIKSHEKEEIKKYINEVGKLHFINLFYQNYISQDPVFEDYQIVSSNDYPKTLTSIGDMYFKGEIFDKNHEKAREYYELGAKLKDIGALNKLGDIYFNGVGVGMDFFKAKIYYEQAEQLIYFEEVKNNLPEALSKRLSRIFLNLGKIYYFFKNIENNYIKAKDCFEKSAARGNAEAYVHLGNLYYFGYGAEKDYSKARECYEKAAEKNYSEGFLSLGNLYELGLGVDVDYDLAIFYYEQAEEKNNPGALVKLGNLYYTGKGFDKNINKALYYWEKASEMGDPLGNVGLVMFYASGVDVKEDYTKALQYILDIAKKKGIKSEFIMQQFKQMIEKNTENGLRAIMSGNNDLSLLIRGNNYYNGILTKIDYNEARKCYELLAQRNNPRGYLMLGHMYYHGNGVKVDYNKAKMYLKKASALNDSDAFLMLGCLYYEFDKKYKKAKKYLEIAAKQNNSNAILMLGNLYLYGHGVQRNYKKAKELYEKAIGYHNVFGYYNLGMLYYYGKGVEQSYSKAKELFEKSEPNESSSMMLGHLYYKERNVGRDAKRDYFKARLFYEKSFTLKSIYKLGEIYENGYGVKKNYTKAREYYELAAKKNFHRACLKLGDFYKNGLGVQINMKKSIDYYFISFEQRDKNAAFNLGNFYENGIGVKQDYRRAIYFYNKAAHFKNFNAFLKLANIYLNGKGVEIDVDKAIHYLLRLLENDRFIHFSRKYRIEGSFYVGNNDLGLIYITEKQNIEAAHKYIKEAAYS